MVDLFADHLQHSLGVIKRDETIANKIDVKEDQCFVGWDAYKQVLAAPIDLVLLATPPHFRPLQLRAAIEAGKHVFAERPDAVDAPGVRAVMGTRHERRKT